MIFKCVEENIIFYIVVNDSPDSVNSHTYPYFWNWFNICDETESQPIYDFHILVIMFGLMAVLLSIYSNISLMPFPEYYLWFYYVLEVSSKFLSPHIISKIWKLVPNYVMFFHIDKFFLFVCLEKICICFIYSKRIEKRWSQMFQKWCLNQHKLT